MKFHRFKTMYHAFKGVAQEVVPDADCLRIEEWYMKMLKMPEDVIDHIFFGGPMSLASECGWVVDRRPYYSVYPAFMRALLRVPLDVPAELVQLPMPAFTIDFAEGHELLDGDYKITSVLAWTHTFKADGRRILTITLDIDDGTLGGKRGMWSLYLTEGETIESLMNKVAVMAESDTPLRSKAHDDCVRLVIGVSLLAHDPSVIEPDVLVNDFAKWEATGDPKYAERAKRRGKYGFVLGRNIEVIPHVRRGHAALRWTGAGRTVPRVVWIKQTIVHRDIAAKVPSGLLDSENERNEDHG